ncbi:Stk1 family PASTA domain-containing Ser/Thr kinase [Georgenia sp. H159]|uniref:Stk1 family PASTA domain-containing Ser/Thr kinase n=1 Tax=Georgenia sp. H159 TaxID=3076115 RepID=UPI002D776DCE|nr:Stk1 family PASTA domain-containing Ser/Thr kinase [Georgenia sp. H159]
MQRTVSDPLLGRLVDGRYEVRSRVARGGMATVYRAVDRRLDRTVALKVMHPHLAESSDFVARFRREARSAARLNHPGIVAIYDQGTAEDASYLTMELIEGHNLRAELRRAGALPLGRALEVVDGVLAALACAHRAGVVHRDVKPENVLIEPEGRPKVTDFGLARAVTEATAASTGTVLGTVAYLAPEIVTSGVADARADVYAVGIVLFELLVGSPPFVADQPIRVAFQHVNDGVPVPSSRLEWLPAEVDELVAALTARDPEDRPTDADAALALLRRTRAALDDATLARRADVEPCEPSETDAGSDSAATDVTPVSGGTVALPIGAIAPGPAGPDAVPGGRGRRRRRRRVFALTMLLLLLAVAGGGSWWWFSHGPGAYVAVPEVVGLSEDEAVGVLTDAGIDLRVEREHHDTAPEQEVVAADPEPGDQVRKDGTVVLHVSRGILMVTVPPVVGLSQDEATEALEEAQLGVGEVQTPWDDEVPQGQVISASPAPEEVIPYNQPVDLVVSAGREPVELVSVVGADAETAAADLDAAGLGTVVEESYHASVPAGRVISQAPSPGDGVQLYRGDEVTVTVSLGPQPVELPNLVGRQVDAASQELRAAGFEVEVERVLGGIFGTVRSMSPGAGEMAVPGTTVTLTVV